MTRFYLESVDTAQRGDINDERDRWDADESFWRIDTWTDAQLADEQRFGHYMQNAHRRGAK